MIGLLPLIAGLVLWLGTSMHTLGIVLTILGGILIIVQVVFMATAIAVLVKAGKRVCAKLW